MSRKKLRFKFDSPAVTVFVALSILIFVINLFTSRQFISFLCECRALKATANSVAFDLKNVMDYVRLFLHVFANKSWDSLFISCLFLLMLGPVLEERYGTPVLSLMMAFSALVTGVISVCTNCTVGCGSDCLIFMMIALTSLTAFSKRSLPVSWIFIFVCYIAFRVYYFSMLPRATTSFTVDNSSLALIKKNIPVFINLLGGIVGSIFGFFVLPKKKKLSGGIEDDDATISFEDMKSLKAKKTASKKAKPRKNEETVIGTIEL